MPKCSKIQRPKTTICAGALRETIKLQLRTQVAPKTQTATSSMQFNCLQAVKAMVITKSGVDAFDGTNTNSLFTHEFTIRYITNIDTTSFVEYNCKYFDIDRIININEENRYLTLICTERGTKDKKVNFS